jgi:hypothetical protein
MPSSLTLRSQPPKIGIQYPNRMSSSVRLLLAGVRQQPAEIARNRRQCRPRSHGLDIGVVVGCRVDVVGNEPAIGSLDELKPGDADVVRGGTRTIRIGCNVAFDVGLYTFKYDPPPPRPPKKDTYARYTYVYEYVGGRWLIAHHHSSVQPQPKQ